MRSPYQVRFARMTATRWVGHTFGVQFSITRREFAVKTRLLTVAVLVIAAAPALGQRPLIGTRAPTLSEGVTWLKGQGPGSWRPDQIYVVDFWARWCGECFVAFPHLLELEQRYRPDGVVVVAMATMLQAPVEQTEAHVARYSETLPGIVGVDPTGSVARRFGVSETGVPSIVIVDREGRLAWVGVGSQASVDETLEQIVAGIYDIGAAAARDRHRASAEREGRPLVHRAETALADERFGEAAEAYLAAFRIDQETFAWVLVDAYLAALADEDAELAARAGNEAVRTALGGNNNELLRFAKAILDDAPESARDLELALDLASLAVENSSGEDWTALFILGRVHASRKEYVQALLAQDRVIALLGDGVDPRVATSLAKFRESYRREVRAAAGK